MYPSLPSSLVLNLPEALEVTRPADSQRYPTHIEQLEARVLLSNQAIWIEGESAFSKNFNGNWLQADASIDRTQLSPGTPGSVNGAWIAHWGGAGAVQAQYTLTVPEAGNYHLWARLQTYNFGSNRIYTYQINSGPQVVIDDADVSSQQNLTLPNNGGSFSGATVGWVDCGWVNSLGAGSDLVASIIVARQVPAQGEVGIWNGRACWKSPA